MVRRQVKCHSVYKHFVEVLFYIYVYLFIRRCMGNKQPGKNGLRGLHFCGKLKFDEKKVHVCDIICSIVGNDIRTCIKLDTKAYCGVIH